LVLTQEHQAAFLADPALAGRSRLSIYDLAQAVRRAEEEK